MSGTVNSLFRLLRKKSWRLVTAESCTGGLISQMITNEAGSSEVFDCGFVPYSYDAKVKHLNVSADSLMRHGAVSQQVVEEMAVGALKVASNAQIAVSVTGIAGPGGGTAEKPVGFVWLAVAYGDIVESYQCQFQGDREAVRNQTAAKAFALLSDVLIA